MRELLVAKYNEDISWTRRYADAGWKLTVYDKSDAPIEGSIRLPNVGRESDTYLRHIIDRYDTLSERTVFAQGHPFDHCTHFDLYVDWMKDEEFFPLTLYFCMDNRDGFPQGYHPDMPQLLRNFYVDVMGHEPPKFIRYTMGCQFIASADRIRKRPKAFYERLLHEVMPKYGHGQWIGFGWMMERLWHTVFGPINPDYAV